MLGYIRYSLNMFLVIAILLALSWTAAWKLAGAKLFSVQSGSMSPAINKGDLVIDIRPEAVQAGDIITYASAVHPGQEVTHRIISTDPARQTVVTKGDNLKIADPAVPASAISGRVFKVVPKAGYVYDFANKPEGLVALVYLPAILIIILELWSLASRLNYRTYSLLKTS